MSGFLRLLELKKYESTTYFYFVLAFYFEKKDDDKNASAEAEAQAAKIGIWREAKPQRPWEYKEKLRKAKEKSSKNKD